YQYNHLGTVVGLSDGAGHHVATVDTDAFGNPLASAQTGVWATSLGERGLTTKELDATSGMYYFYQRWYDPQTATFASRAPYPPMMEHPYGYGLNNPIRFVDLDGRQPSANNDVCLSMVGMNCNDYFNLSSCPPRPPSPDNRWRAVNYGEWWDAVMESTRLPETPLEAGAHAAVNFVVLGGTGASLGSVAGRGIARTAPRVLPAAGKAAGAGAGAVAGPAVSAAAGGGVTGKVADKGVRSALALAGGGLGAGAAAAIDKYLPYATPTGAVGILGAAIGLAPNLPRGNPGQGCED
ncbi:MAG: hypothetical protein JJU11_15100, partial [Candidatus Sumerlaeia bacterium]|nr:hypothetical protein [Candidatus Sumerlaeia bacterium]